MGSIVILAESKRLCCIFLAGYYRFVMNECYFFVDGEITIIAFRHLGVVKGSEFFTKHKYNNSWEFPYDIDGSDVSVARFHHTHLCVDWRASTALYFVANFFQHNFVQSFWQIAEKPHKNQTNRSPLCCYNWLICICKIYANKSSIFVRISG